MTNTNDTIDLKELIIKSILIVKKHKFLLLIFVILGILAGIYEYKTTKPFYETEMIITSNLVYEKQTNLYSPDLQSIISILEVINKNIDNEEFLKNQLNITNPDAILKISAKVIRNANLTSVDPKNISISISVSDKNIIKDVQKSIISYCNNNEYIIQKFNEQKKLKNQSIQIINDRINKIDSLNQTNKQNLVDYNSYSSIINLELQKDKLTSSNYSNPTTIVQGFSEYPTINSKKGANSVLAFIIFIFLSLATITFIELIKYFKNV